MSVRTYVMTTHLEREEILKRLPHLYFTKEGKPGVERAVLTDGQIKVYPMLDPDTAKVTGFTFNIDDQPSNPDNKDDEATFDKLALACIGFASALDAKPEDPGAE